MNKSICILVVVICATGTMMAQGPNDLNEGFRISAGSGGTFNLAWWGRSSRNYFIQQSDDLSSGWNYMPIIEPGADQVIQWGFSSNSAKNFFRLQFDNDLDGLPDAWEMQYYNHLGVGASTLSLRGDGLTNLQVLYQGLDPLTPYNTTQPGTGQNVPVVTLGSSAMTTLNAPATLTLSSTASETGGTIARVDFYQNGSYLGSDWSSPYTWSMSNVPPGNYQFTAVAVDASNFTTVSNPVTVAVAPVLTSAASTRYSRGNGTDPSYLSYVVAVDFEKGIQLNPVGTAQFSGTLPWFMRIQKTTAYQVNLSGTTLNYAIPFENPVAAFGTEAGGSTLYTGQSYSFGLGSGGEYFANTQLHDFQLELYDRSTLSSGQTNVAPVLNWMITLPRPGTAGWETFAQNGYVQEDLVTGTNGAPLVKVTTQYVAGATIKSGSAVIFSGSNGSDQWGQYLPSPLLVTITAYTSQFYAKLGYMGVTVNKSQTNSQDYWMAVSDTTNALSTGTNSISIAMDFEQRPPWRSVYIDQPQFQGIPLPPSYQGKTLEELLHNSQPVSDTLAAPSTGTLLDLDTSPELRQHPVLDNFVASMGSSNDPTSWALALSNYVLNEIGLTDAISYSDSGAVSDQSINEGGVNRGALATFLEGQGSPAEQCTLLVYLLRKAGIQCGYVFPQHNGMLMIDQELSKLLRMQLKGAAGDLGTSNVPHLIPTNYPWVAAYVGGKWVHIFPWMKDTSIEEGQDLYQYLPDNYQTGKQWLNKYLLDDPAIRSLSSEYDNPGVLFPLFVKNALKTSFPTVSIAQIGVNIYDRKNYFTSWSDLPRPWQSPVISGSNLVDNLSSIPNIFDTITVNVFSDRNKNGMQDSGEPAITTGTMRMVDLHNRRFLMYAVQTGTSNAHTLKLSLEAFRPSTQGNTPGTFSTSDTLLNSQLATVSLTGTDDALVFQIDYKRHQSLGFSFVTPDHWSPFLGLNDTLEIKDSRPLRKGDMAAFVLNYGRVTSAMLNVHAQQYQTAQQQAINNPGQAVDPEIAQGLPAFMMGMSYYFNVSQTKQQLLNLTKSNVVSFFGHGFAKLSPKRNNDAAGTLINNGQISLIYPKVDMSFQRTAWANNGTLHPDSGNEEFPPLNDWSPVFIGEVSAQEHRTINKFFQKSAAISTVKLLDIAQGSTPGSSVVRIDASNYDITTGTASPWNNNYTVTVNGTSQTKTLAQWAGYPASGSLYDNIVNGNNGLGGFSAWDANYQQVLITPGPITGANGIYQGMGAFVTGITTSAAYITDNINVQNGGWGVPNYASIDSTINSISRWSLQPTTDFSYTMANPYNQAGGVTTSSFTPSSFSFQNPASGLDGISVGTIVINDPVSVNSYNRSSALLFPTGGAPIVQGISTDASIVQDVANYGGVTETTDNRSLFGALGKAVLDPVNTVTGEFYVDAVDIRLDGPMPLEIRRNYGSRNLADGNFGYGWKMAYVPYLIMSQDSNQSLIFASEMDGSVVAYRRQGSPTTRWLPATADNPQLTNVAGDSAGSLTNILNNRIDQTSSGGYTYYTLSGADGSKRTFQVRSYVTPSTSGSNDGLTRTRPYLQSWKDNRGNFYSFQFYGDDPGENYTTPGFGNIKRIVSSNGSFIGFDDDIYGHIIDAYTNDGRRVYYQYDSYGDLTQATLPDASTLGYQYSHRPAVSGSGFYSEHLLVEEDKPQGRILVNTYDNAVSRRVTQQQATVGQDFSLVTNATFGYFNSDGTVRATDTPNTSISGYTTITDVNNQSTKYEYANGLLTKITDPLNQTIIQTWFQAGDGLTGSYQRSLKSRTDKRGLLTEFQYDSNGNLTQKKVTGDIAGNGASDVALTTFTYNSLNMVTQSSDPLFTTIYTYGDSAHPYQPTSVEKRTSGGTISTMVMQYQDLVTGTASAYGLLQRETKAAGTSDQAVTNFTYSSNGWLTQSSRPTGTSDPAIVMNYAYNMRGELTSESDALNRSTKYAYDGRGNRVWSERHDETGALVAWDYEYYNQNGEIEWSDGPRYNPEDYVLRKYDGAGRLSQQIKWRSQASSDGSGVQAVPGVDSAYATTFYVHDTFGNLTEIRDPRNVSTTMQYDFLGQMLGRQVHNGDSTTAVLSSESFQYEPGGKAKKYTNPLTGVTNKYYTSTGQLKRQENPDGTVHQWRYDFNGRVVTETLSNGGTWTTAYNDAARTVTRTYSSGTSSTVEVNSFDRRGNLISKLDSEGNLFTTSYDAADRVSVTSGPSGYATAQESTTHSYGAGEKAHIVTDALGQKTYTISDALGREILCQVMDRRDNVLRQTSHVYSPDGNSVTTIAGVGPTAISTTTFTDTFGKPILIKHGDGTFALMAYDNNENLVESEDESQFITLNSYDALNRLSAQSLPGGATTTFIYDAAGNELQRQMPGGQTHWQTFDNASRKLTETLTGSVPNGLGATLSGTTRNFTYSYYPTGSSYVGQLQTKTDSDGVTFTTVYDDFLRVHTVTATGSLAQQNETLTFGYDTLGRVTEVAQNFASSSVSPPTLVLRGYDAYGHITIETDSIVSGSGVQTTQINQSWDAAGNRTTLTSQPVTGAGMSYSYNYWPDGLLKQENVGGSAYTFNYDTNGLLTSRQSTGRTQTITQRDAQGRVTAEQDTIGGGTPLIESQLWAGRSQRLFYTANRNGPGVWNETRYYAYNGRGQLAYESDAPSATSTSSFLYRFDFESATTPATGAGLGVRTVAFRENSPSDSNVEPGSWLNNDPAVVGGTNGRGVDAFERPVMELAFPAAANFSYASYTSYDALGQLGWRSYWTSGGSPQNRQQATAWDAFGRLLVLQDGDSTWSAGYLWTAVYDGLGRRLRTTKQSISGGSLTGSVLRLDSYYDPQAEFLELGIGLNGARTWKVYGPDLNGKYGALDGIGGLEATVDESSGTATPLVSNAFGDVVGIASSGTMAWSPARIGSYGLLPGSPAAPMLDGTAVTLSQAVLWRGYRMDPTTFYYIGARYYDPASGRFLSPDPLGHGASMDLYSYANGDPVNGLDPDGRFGKAAGSFAYNGLGVGQGLSALSSNLDSLTNDSIGNDNSLLAYSAAAGSSIAGSLSSLLTPKVYVDGASQFAGNIGTVYNNSRTTGESVLAASMLATGYGLTSWNVGAIYQGVNNVNVLSGQPLGGWGARTQSILSGVAGTAFAAAGVAAPIVSAGTPIFGADTAAGAGSQEIVPYSGQLTPTSWPENGGFLGTASNTELSAGTLIDRYGARGGTYVSPVGTPFPNRGIPASSASLPLESYDVVSPITVKSGLAAPAFGQPGLGTQYQLPLSVQELIDAGVLKPR